jgi:hypothetical protein
MFPVRYELNFYINLLRNSVFKGLKTAVNWCSSSAYTPDRAASSLNVTILFKTCCYNIRAPLSYIASVNLKERERQQEDGERNIQFPQNSRFS